MRGGGGRGGQQEKNVKYTLFSKAEKFFIHRLQESQRSTGRYTVYMYTYTFNKRLMSFLLLR